MSQELERLTAALADRYRIAREVGSGGMATVYLADDLKHDRRVAVKVLRPELAAAIGADRFGREIHIAARLTHAHILPLHDSGRADDYLYYVMPFVEGPSLRERIVREGQLGIEESLEILEAVGSALDYAHQQGVVHRDIKPDNILFSASDPMLADFGIALVMDAADGERLTETGLSLGTPAYMSPEQAAGESRIDARSDIYSLACVLYEMLAGQPPFVGGNARATLARHVTDPVPPLATVRPSIAEGLEKAVFKALHKVPMDRFGTVLEFIQALTHSETTRDWEAEKTLAVMPFANLSVETDSQLFCDGLTDEVISGLSAVRSLQVASRTSSMQLKGTEKNLRAIGRELNVRYVIEGSVRRIGNRLRITVQLVDAAEDVQLWSERFGGKVEEALEVQEEVSNDIVDAVRMELAPGERPADETTKRTNPHAYECYLRARRDIFRFTENAIINALSYLQEAVEIVGEDILLYAGIAEAYYVFPHIGGNEPDACLSSVDECSRRIFALDKNAAHGHCLRGLLARKRDRDVRASAASLKRALDLMPDDPGILFWNGFYAAQSGDEALAQVCVERLVRVDPRAPRSQWAMGWYQLMQGRFDWAVEAYRRALELDPTNVQIQFHHGFALAAAGHVDEAAEVWDGMTKEAPKHVCARLGKFYKFAIRNQRALALKTVPPEAKGAARWSETFSYHMAECHALVGETAQAIEWLDNAVRRGFVNRQYLTKHAPFLSGLYEVDRFQEVMDGAGAAAGA